MKNFRGDPSLTERIWTVSASSKSLKTTRGAELSTYYCLFSEDPRDIWVRTMTAAGASCFLSLHASL